MHRHTWVVKSTVRLASAWELMNVGAPVTELKGRSGMFVQPMIVTYRCVACGSEKVKRV